MVCPHTNRFEWWCDGETKYVCTQCKVKFFANGDLYQQPEELHKRIKELEARNKSIYQRLDELERFIDSLKFKNLQ